MTEQRPTQDRKRQNVAYHIFTVTWSLLVRIISSVALTIVFYLIVTPIGLLLRLTGRDPMGLGEKSNDITCRVRSKVRDAKHLEKPY